MLCSRSHLSPRTRQWLVVTHCVDLFKRKEKIHEHKHACLSHRQIGLCQNQQKYQEIVRQQCCPPEQAEEAPRPNHRTPCLNRFQILSQWQETNCWFHQNSMKIIVDSTRTADNLFRNPPDKQTNYWWRKNNCWYHQNGKWNGLMASLVEKKYDLVLTALKVKASHSDQCLLWRCLCCVNGESWLLISHQTKYTCSNF